MAKVLLDANETFELSSNAIILGNTGIETVKILKDSIEITTDAAVERIEFTHNSSDYTYKTSMTGMQVLYGNKVVANVSSGQNLIFNDGTAAIEIGAFDLVTLSAPITLNGKIVSNVASSLDIFSASTPSSIIRANDNVAATTGNDIFSLTQSDSSYSATISGFDYLHDKIQIPIGQQNPFALSGGSGVNNIMDGNVDLTWFPTTYAYNYYYAVEIHLVGLDQVTETALQLNAVPQVFIN